MAVSAGMPVFAICRGFQEMNVAFGGTLHQRVHDEPDHIDHREDKDDPLDVQYGPRIACGSRRPVCSRSSRAPTS
jgi:putative glutamine amidotransferase